METYTIGGPIFIPHHMNSNKTKLFFFWSQEYTGQFVTGGVADQIHADGAGARRATSRRAFKNNGTLIAITDPTTGAPFPGNIIPANRASRRWGRRC